MHCNRHCYAVSIHVIRQTDGAPSSLGQGQGFSFLTLFFWQTLPVQHMPSGVRHLHGPHQLLPPPAGRLGGGGLWSERDGRFTAHSVWPLHGAAHLRYILWHHKVLLSNVLMLIYYLPLISAAYVLLTTLVLADLLGADKFTNAFGLLLLFQGVATLIGPPIVGELFWKLTLADVEIRFFRSSFWPLQELQLRLHPDGSDDRIVWTDAVSYSMY